MHEVIPRYEIEAACAFLRQAGLGQPRVGLITGSGLAPLAEEVQGARTVSFDRIPGFPHSTVRGHTGRLLWGRLGGQSVAVMQGRVHFYEGHSIQRVVFPVRVLARLGIELLIVTNAAGGLNPSFQAGDIMLIIDHLNLAGMWGFSPLWGPNDEELGPRFVDLRQAYDPGLGELVERVAAERSIPLRQGVYAWLVGPSFETPAEIRLLRLLGADAVGMSTVPEVIAARHMGVRVLGLSHISNLAVEFGAPTEDLHQEVLAAGDQALPRLKELLLGVLEALTG